MTAQSFTVFCMDGYWPAGKREVPADLLSAIEYAASEDAEYPPVAWAAEPVITHGGTKGWAELRAESIAAGRLIEFRDGKYIPLGVAEEAPDEVTKAVQFLAGRMEARKAAANTTERVRPPLTWATPKPVDRWEGFTVRSFSDFDEMGNGNMEALNNHPLQRMTDPSDPLHGSAWLKVR